MERDPRQDRIRTFINEDRQGNMEKGHALGLNLPGGKR